MVDAHKALMISLVIVGCGAPAQPPIEPAPLPAPPPQQSVQNASNGKDPDVPAISTDPFVNCTSGAPAFRDANRAPKELTEEQKRAISDAEGFIHDHHGSSDASTRREIANHEYIRAKTLFEANHWTEVAVASRAISFDFADTDAGSYASQFYIESLSMLGGATEPRRPDCYQAMSHDVPVLVDLYCDTRKAKVDASKTTCSTLLKIRRDIDRLEAQKIVERADSFSDPTLYEQAGDLYLGLAQRCVKETLANHTTPKEERCDEVAYNAGRCFLAAQKLDRAHDAVRFMMEPSNGMHTSELTRRLSITVAQTQP